MSQALVEPSHRYCGNCGNNVKPNGNRCPDCKQKVRMNPRKPRSKYKR